MIPDTHGALEGWGIRPVLFRIAEQPVMSYSFFLALGLLAAIALYFLNVRDRGIGGDGLYVALAAVVGGIVGAKVPAWVLNLDEFIADPTRLDLMLSGRTIVGGFIGGIAAVYLTKRRLGITARLGNYLVPSLCAGIFLGRIGCFLAGCCYGVGTGAPWGVDFGDGVLRNPTQLYEALFVLAFFVYAQVTLGRQRPGMLFRQFVIAYFTWRFAVEFIRVNPVWGLGLTYYQVAAAAIVAGYVLRGLAGLRKESADGRYDQPAVGGERAADSV